MKRFCKVLISLNKYKGVPCSSTQDGEYTFEVEWFASNNPFNEGCYTLTAYKDGVQSDIFFNDWVFCGVSQGSYHYPGSYSAVRLDIECCDPNGAIVKENTSIRETDDFLNVGATLYMNKIMLICLFKDKTEYESVAMLFTKPNVLPMNMEKLIDYCSMLHTFSEVIKRNECNKAIPSHFIEYAKMEYKRIVNYAKGNIDWEGIFDKMLDRTF